MISVVAATLTGWLLLFFVLLVMPPREAERAAPTETQGVEPPAVVSALARRLDRDGFGVTLADLAARGWFQLSGAPGPTGPVMCVVPAEPPAEPLAPYERRVVAHVARRAGVRNEVPAPALSDSFEGGEQAFMKAFREEVTADAVQRGLTRPRLSGRRIGLLCLVLFVPAGALALALDAAHQRYPLAIPAVAWVVVAMVTGGIGASRRPSAAGRAVLDRWHAAADAARSLGGDARLGAYAAALGRAPGVVAVFAAPKKDMVWSSYRGSWQLLPVETHTWSWPKAIAFLLGIIFGPMVFIGGLIWLFVSGLGWVGERVLELAAGAAVVGIAIWAMRRMAPRFAEFDGQVIRQTFTEHDEDPDEYRVVVDDGVRDAAWDLRVPPEAWRMLDPGTFVRARVNLHNRDVIIHPVEPPAVARPLADVAAEQERAVRAVRGALPDPGALVTAAEAAGALRREVRGRHADGPASRAMIWQPVTAAQPILRIEVRPAQRLPGVGPPVPPGARPVAGVANGYLLGPSAVLYAGSCTVTVGIHGAGPAQMGTAEMGTADEASLTHLLLLVAARLPGLVSKRLRGSGRVPRSVRNNDFNQR